MAKQPPLSTAERVRRAAYAALEAADGLEIVDRTTARHDQLVDDVEVASADMRAAVRGTGPSSGA